MLGLGSHICERSDFGTVCCDKLCHKLLWGCVIITLCHTSFCEHTFGFHTPVGNSNMLG